MLFFISLGLILLIVFFMILIYVVGEVRYNGVESINNIHKQDDRDIKYFNIDKVKAALKSKCVFTENCKFCNGNIWSPVKGFTSFELWDGYASHVIKKSDNYIVSVSIICENCGYIASFSTSVLGLFEMEKGEI